jgi:hypothetical protein
MGYYRASSKSPLADGYRQVAMDAFLEGRIDEGEKLLASTRTRLTKPQAKKVAKELLAGGKTDAAMRVLVGAMGKESAELELREAPTAKVGDVLYTSWGYEQSNVDFYEVVAVSGQMATVREIQKRVVDRGQYDNGIIGDRGAYVGPPKRVRVQKSYRAGEYHLKIDDHHAWQWDGKPHRETAAGYGH